MGYSQRKFQKERKERPWQVHPAWRGIGCILLILVPIMAWAGTSVFLENGALFDLPDELTEPIIIQKTQVEWVNQVIVWLNGNLGGRGLTYAQILVWLAFVIIGITIFSILYGLVYRLLAPPRYGPLDSPPIKKGFRR